MFGPGRRLVPGRASVPRGLDSGELRACFCSLTPQEGLSLEQVGCFVLCDSRRDFFFLVFGLILAIVEKPLSTVSSLRFLQESPTASILPVWPAVPFHI